MMRYIKIKNFAILMLIFGIIFLACSKKESKEKSASENTETQDEKIAQEFSIHVFIDTTKSAPAKVGAMFLKSSLLDGDYKTAINFLCRQNQGTIAHDSLAGYVILGRNNPGWDSLTAFKYEITRRYIPVLAAMNVIRDIEQLSCKDTCLLQYKVAGPLFLKKIFDAAIGPDGKKRFDTMVDSNISIAEMAKFYDHAFERLSFVADSLDFAKRLDVDTLRLIRENSDWKVCKKANSSFDIFRQQ